MFAFFSPKTFGSCSLELLSKRCAQRSAAKSEEMGEAPDHTPEAVHATLLSTTYGAVCLSAALGQMSRGPGDGRVSRWPPDQQPEGWRDGKLCSPNTYRTVPSWGRVCLALRQS